MEFDFEKSTQLDNLDGVPDQFKGVYAQGSDGKWVINETLKGAVDAITGLNKALKSERTAHSTLKGQKDVGTAVAEALKDFGITDLDSAKAKIAELTEAVAKNSKVDPAKIKAEIEATFKGERDGFNAKLSGMQATLDRHLVENAALSALAAAKGSSTLLLPHIKAKAKVVQDGDDYVVRVLDADGQYRGDGKGGFMSVADLVNEMKVNSEFKAAFASDAPSGGGAKPNQQQPSRQQQQRQQNNDAEMTPQERIAKGLAARRGGR